MSLPSPGQEDGGRRRHSEEKKIPPKKGSQPACLAAAAESAFEATEPGPPQKKKAWLRKLRAPDKRASGDGWNFADPQTGVAKGRTLGRNMRSKCRCSMCPAIHINSRSWLRSSSTHEPSDPPPKVVSFFFRFKAVARPAPPTQEACEASWSRPIEKLAKMKRLRIEKQTKKARGRHPSTRPTGLFKPSPTDGRPLQKKGNESFLPPPTQGERERAAVSVGFPCRKCRRLSYPREKRARHPEQARYPTVTVFRVAGRPKRENFKPGQTLRTSTLSVSHLPSFTDDCGGRSNDPSAGSPTETLLRLLLPLNDQVRASSRPTAPPVKGGPRPIRGPH